MYFQNVSDKALPIGSIYEGTPSPGGAFLILSVHGWPPFRNRPAADYRAASSDYKPVVDRPVQDTAVYPVAQIGRKDDSGKLDMTLLDDMPRALAAVVEVMQWAITKKAPHPYERSSWLGVHADRYRAAIFRHRLAAAKQASAVGAEAARFQPDDETKLLHLAHEATSALMALENTLREIEKNYAGN